MGTLFVERINNRELRYLIKFDSQKEVFLEKSKMKHTESLLPSVRGER